MKRYILVTSSLVLMSLTMACAANPDEAGSSESSALAAADDATLRRGKIMFLQCRACHSTEAGGENKVGPNLNGIFTAKSGQKEGFVYSEAMREKAFRWDAESIDAFITNPSEYVPGTIMAFVGVESPKDRAALIAYLYNETQ